MESSKDPSPLDNLSVSEDRLLNGRVRLRQPKTGYRAGMDAALLAAACDAGPGERVLEAGCGVGAAILAAAARRPGASFLGLERDGQMAALAIENARLNGVQDRLEILAGDIGQRFAALGRPPFDAVICNPPFYDDPDSMRAPHPARAGAYLADEGLPAWISFLLKAAREGGTITVIHRADRLGDLLALLAPKSGSFRIRPVQPFADAPAKRVLVRAIKTGRAPLVLLPPLVLHERSGGKHTDAAEAILRGEADLGWG
jgi:tRNA1(Val) A37 N6-methylase TrmN6